MDTSFVVVVQPWQYRDGLPAGVTVHRSHTKRDALTSMAEATGLVGEIRPDGPAFLAAVEAPLYSLLQERRGYGLYLRNCAASVFNREI
jgi:hypothetical protein